MQNWPLYKNYKADVSSVSPLLLGGFGGFSNGMEGEGNHWIFKWNGGGITRREQGVIIVVQITRVNYSFII